MLQTDNLQKELVGKIEDMKKTKSSTIQKNIDKLKEENKTANDARKADIVNQIAELKAELRKLSQ